MFVLWVALRLCWGVCTCGLHTGPSVSGLGLIGQPMARYIFCERVFLSADLRITMYSWTFYLLMGMSRSERWPSLGYTNSPVPSPSPWPAPSHSPSPWTWLLQGPPCRIITVFVFLWVTSLTQQNVMSFKSIHIVAAVKIPSVFLGRTLLHCMCTWHSLRSSSDGHRGAIIFRFLWLMLLRTWVCILVCQLSFLWGFTSRSAVAGAYGHEKKIFEKKNAVLYRAFLSLLRCSQRAYIK